MKNLKSLRVHTLPAIDTQLTQGGYTTKPKSIFNLESIKEIVTTSPVVGGPVSL